MSEEKVCTLCEEKTSDIKRIDNDLYLCYYCWSSVGETVTNHGGRMTWEERLEVKLQEDRLLEIRREEVRTRNISSELRTKIYERDKYRCRYCGGYEGGLCIDHIIPISKNGTTEEHNLATSCTSCNLKKSDHLLKDMKDMKLIRPEEIIPF